MVALSFDRPDHPGGSPPSPLWVVVLACVGLSLLFWVPKSAAPNLLSGAFLSPVLSECSPGIPPSCGWSYWAERLRRIPPHTIIQPGEPTDRRLYMQICVWSHHTHPALPGRGGHHGGFLRPLLPHTCGLERLPGPLLCLLQLAPCGHGGWEAPAHPSPMCSLSAPGHPSLLWLVMLGREAPAHPFPPIPSNLGTRRI